MGNRVVQTMSHWQRGIGILTLLVILSSWCILLGGIGGWFLGYDQGRRETAETFLPETGVLVTRVERGSPAEEAGLARGHVIVAVNGVSIHDVVSLRDELLRYRPGDQVLLTYRHELGEHVTHVLLGNFPGRKTPYLGIYFTARAEQPADI